MDLTTINADIVAQMYALFKNVTFDWYIIQTILYDISKYDRYTSGMYIYASQIWSTKFNTPFKFSPKELSILNGA